MGWSTRGILGGTAVLAAATLLGKFVTLLKDASVAAEFGATRTSDELMLAQLYPAIICGVAAGAVAMALPPAVEMARKRTGGQPSFRQVSLIVGLCMGALLVAGLSSVLWARPLLSLTARDWSTTEVDTAAGYVAGFFLFSWLSAATSLVAVFLTTRRRFLAGGLAVAVNGLFASILVLTLGGRLGGEALVIGSIIDGALGLALVVVVLAVVSRGGHGTRPERIEWRALRAIAVPAIIVSILTTIPLLVERSSAASLTPGDVAVLGWAQKIAALPLALAILPLSQAVYPSLARRSEHNDDSPDLGLGSVSGYYVLVGLSSVCAAIAIGVAAPLVAVILQHGRFDATAAGHATGAVRILLVGVPGAALLTLASRVLYARSQGARVALGFVLGVVAELAVLYPALHRFGLNGLCLAMAVCLSVTGVALLWAVKPTRSSEIGPRELLKGGAMMGAGLGAAWVAAWALQSWPAAALALASVLGGSAALAIGFGTRSVLTAALLSAWTAVRKRWNADKTPVVSNGEGGK